MWDIPEAPGWELRALVTGRCQECGADLSGETRVHATAEWVERYHHDSAFQRTVNEGIKRRALERHARTCAGRQVERRDGQRELAELTWARPA